MSFRITDKAFVGNMVQIEVEYDYPDGSTRTVTFGRNMSIVITATDVQIISYLRGRVANQLGIDLQGQAGDKIDALIGQDYPIEVP